MSNINKKLNYKLWVLSLVSSLLLSIPYIFPHLGLISLIAFVPLFAAEYLAREGGVKRFFFVYYSSFLVWNLITTFWVWFATPGGALAAFLLNSLQMAVIFALFRWMRGIAKGFLPYLFFIFAWLTWEHYYFTWDITWPWLVLGNSFATSIKSIQWYEYTGTLGGSFWILLVNSLLFRLIILYLKRDRVIASALSLIAVVILPLIFSHYIYFSYKEEDRSVKVTALQPNIDPYTDKFMGLTQQEQDNILVKLMDESAGDSSLFVLAPETFIGWSNPMLTEGREYLNPSYSTFNNWVKNSNSCLVLGAVTLKYYDNNSTLTPTATKVNSRYWVDRFNSALFLVNGAKTDYYHKSKLVILAESNPFKNSNFEFIEKLVGDMAGGGIGNFGTQPTRSLFAAPNGTKIGVAICYESVFGEFYREYTLNGAEIMGIITNDGWWKDTPGHKQHLHYASLRAIETRRSIARSANTGISALIDQRGDVISQLGWAKRGYVSGALNLNSEITVFVKYGDIIGRVSSFIFALFLLMGISRKISKKYIIKEAC